MVQGQAGDRARRGGGAARQGGKVEALQNGLPHGSPQEVEDCLRTAKDALLRALAAAEGELR